MENNSNTKLPSNQTCARIHFLEWRKDVLTLEILSYDRCYFMLYLYLNAFIWIYNLIINRMTKNKNMMENNNQIYLKF